MIQDNFADTQRGEPLGNLLPEGRSLFARHHHQGQFRSCRTSDLMKSVLGSKANGVHRRADARCGRISAAATAVAVRSPGRIQYDRPGAGTAGVKSEKEGFQFGLIGCREES